jgi:hypothetical protein
LNDLRGAHALDAPAPRLVLLTRPGCGLCEEMERALVALARRVPLPPIELADVDADPVLAHRYALEIPVLLIDGVPACRVELDPEALLRLLRPRISGGLTGGTL